MYSDRPIESNDLDLLDRSSFSKRLADSLLSCPTGEDNSFAVGLYGKWGSGKTSILNMVMNELASHKGKLPVIIRFSPWNYTTRNQLLEQFFHILTSTLQAPDKSKKLQKVGKVLEKYSSALQFTQLIPGFGQFVAPLIGLLQNAGVHMQEDAEKMNDISKQKDEIVRLLQEQKRRIIVIIDDIDRLNNDQIVLIFQLVNSIAGFPRMVYLLSFDREIVANALKREQDCDGNEYLEKIVQVLFPVPMPPKNAVMNILLNCIEELSGIEDNPNFNQEHWDRVLPFIIEQITSIRDVYRLMNAFQFQYAALGDDVNFIDLLVIVILELFIPDAISWIWDNQRDLLSGGAIAFAAAMGRKEQDKEDKKKELNKQFNKQSSKFISVISAMFPNYGKMVLNIGQTYTHNHYAKIRRINCDEYFELYFSMSLSKVDVQKSKILQTIYELNETQLRAHITRLVKEDKDYPYLRELRNYVDTIPSDRLKMFFGAVIWLSHYSIKKVTRYGFPVHSYFYLCLECALDILYCMDQDMLENSLSEAISQLDYPLMPILVGVTWRVNSDSIGRKFTIDKAILDSLLEILLKKTIEFSANYCWLDSHASYFMLQCWRTMDEVSFDKYIKSMLEDDCNVAKLVSSLMKHDVEKERVEYQFGDINGYHSYNEYLRDEDAHQAVLRLKQTEEFSNLPLNIQLDCVAFSLMNAETNHASHESVLETLQEWKITKETDE